MEHDSFVPAGATTVPLNRGLFAIVDAADLPRLETRNWFATKMGRSWYAVSTTVPRVLMHRFILGAPDHLDVDHINYNGLDNRRENMRLCTRRQNVLGKRPTKRNRSGFKGVHFHRQSGKWRAQIAVYGRIRSLGLYASAEQAAAAYNVAASKEFGEFAFINPLESGVSHL